MKVKYKLVDDGKKETTFNISESKKLAIDYLSPLSHITPLDVRCLERLLNCYAKDFAYEFITQQVTDDKTGLKEDLLHFEYVSKE